MSVIAVVQARMGSTRLPGKVLADVGGVPMLERLLRRAGRAAVDAVVVATSADARDDPVASLANRLGVPVVRGSEQDVLGRFGAVLDAYPADHVVRLTGDCPLIDPNVVGQAIDVHLASEADYTSNTLVRTFPDGLDVEVIRAEALRGAAAASTDRTEREHVTPFVYRRPETYRLAAFRCPLYLGDERWTIDTAADLRWLRSLVGRLSGDACGWEEILSVAGQQAQLTGPRLVPADDSEPSHRVWDLRDDGVRVGVVELSVAAGRGRAIVRTSPDLEPVAEMLLRQRLAADAQVSELSVLQPGSN